jgi:peptidoglycan/xylan/chitin deacetylase (PgdA/CDA1 family)
MAFRPAWTRIAAGCGATVALLGTLASAQGLPGAASLRGAGTSGVVDLAVQAGASLAGAGVITGSTSRRMLHFTFDDGPDRWHTPKLLDTLDRTGHKATFFFSTSRFTGSEFATSTPSADPRSFSQHARASRQPGCIEPGRSDYAAKPVPDPRSRDYPLHRVGHEPPTRVAGPHLSLLPAHG